MFGDPRTKINGLNIVNVTIPGASGSPGVIALTGQEPSGTAYAIWGPGISTNAVIKLPPEAGLIPGYTVILCMVPQSQDSSSPSSALVSVANTSISYITAIGQVAVELNEGFPISFTYWGQVAGLRTSTRYHYWSATLLTPAGWLTGTYGGTNWARTGLSALPGGMAWGTNALSSGSNSIAIGPDSTASATYATAIGKSNTASGVAAVVTGTANTASGAYSQATGLQASTQSIRGKIAHSAGQQSALGDSQTGKFVLRIQTTNATQTVLTSTGSAAATSNQVILPNDSSYMCRVNVVARDTSNGDTDVWDFTVGIRRGANAASTALIAAVTPTITFGDAGAALWTIGVTADTTNGGLAIMATGEAAKTINWVATVWTTEVTG